MIRLDYFLVLLASLHLSSAISLERAASSAAGGNGQATTDTATTFQATTDLGSSTRTETTTTTTVSTTTTTTTTTTTATTTTTCEVGCGSFTQEGSKCFKVFTDVLAYDAAQASCEGYGGNLASIESQDEQDAVFGLTSEKDTWLGASDIVTHLDYLWEDGATFTYTNWFTNRPKDNADQDCMKMKTTGTWDNVVCTKEMQYACQKPYATCGLAATTTTTATCSACGSWTEQGSKCFNVYSTAIEWAAAQTACEGHGGNLASIESADEQTAVEGLLDGTDIWIGGNDITTDQDWSWQDGATWDYTNWWTNRPKTNADQDCVKMKTTGLWDNVSCTTDRPYACQKAITVC